MPIILTSSGITFDVGVQNKSVSGFALGVGTEWQDKTSERAVLTTYTNFADRPVAVFIRMADSTSNACIFEVDGVVISSTAYNNDGNGASSIHCIVPTGSTYRINNNSWPMSGWFELRV